MLSCILTFLLAFTARVRDYIDQHGASTHEYEDTGAENHGDLQEIMERALSSGSVRMRGNIETVEDSRKSTRNDNDRSRGSIGTRSLYKQERSVSRTSHKSTGGEPVEMRRSLQNSAKSIRSSSNVPNHRASPLRKFSPSGRSSVESRDSLKFMNRSPQSVRSVKSLTAQKLTQSVDGRKERLELLNNSQSSQGKSSERYGVNYKRPQSTRTEVGSFFSQSPGASIDYSIRSTYSAKKEKNNKGKQPKEITSLLFPSLGKKLTFKKKLIQDSMHRLQGSDQITVGATRANSMKSGINGEHEFALKQVLANTSLTFESGEFVKSSEDSFQLREHRITSKSSRKDFLEKEEVILIEDNSPQEEENEVIKVVEERYSPSPKKPTQEEMRKEVSVEKVEEAGQQAGGVIQLRELFKHKFAEGQVGADSISKQGAKRGSYPTIGAGSARDSFNASQIFRHSEGESHVMNVSRLNEVDEQFDIAQDKLEEMRRYSMENNVLGWNPENNPGNAAGNQVGRTTVKSQGTPQRVIKEEVQQQQQQEEEEDHKKTRIMQSGSSKRSKQGSEKKDSAKKGSDVGSYHSIKSIGTPLFLSLTQNSASKREISQNSVSKRENSQRSIEESIEKTTEEFRKKLQEKVSKDLSSSSRNSSPKPDVMKKTEIIAQPNPTKKKNSAGDITMIMGVKKRSESLEKEFAKKVFSKPPVPTHSPQTTQLIQSVQQAAQQVKANIIKENKKPPTAVKKTSEAGARKETFGNETPQNEGLRETAEKDLEETADQVHIKTFLALRSILKPHKAISLCCEGLLKLFAGLEDIPEEFLHQENIEWNQTKSAFNVPIKLVNLVSSYKELVANNKISSEKITVLSKTLNKIDEHMNNNHHEAFYQLYDFLNAALIYAQVFAQNKPLELLDSLEEPEAHQPTPMQLMELPRSKTDIINQAYSRANALGGARVSLDSSPMKLVNKKGYKGITTPTKEREISQDRWNNTEALRPKFGNNAGSKSPMKGSVVKNANKITGGVVKRGTVGQQVKNEAKRAISALRNQEMSIKERLQREEEEIIRNRAVLNMDVQPSEAEILIDEIEVKGREAREYRHRVKRMLADHERYVKRFMQQQDDLEVEMNREDALQEWRRLNELLRQQNAKEKEYMHHKNMNYINEKREEKTLKQHQEKENMNDDILENVREIVKGEIF